MPRFWPAVPPGACRPSNNSPGSGTTSGPATSTGSASPAGRHCRSIAALPHPRPRRDCGHPAAGGHPAPGHFLARHRHGPAVGHPRSPRRDRIELQQRCALDLLPQRPGQSGVGLASPGREDDPRGATPGSIAGHAMASVYHAPLLSDVEQTQRVTKTLRKLPRELAHKKTNCRQFRRRPRFQVCSAVR